MWVEGFWVDSFPSIWPGYDIEDTSRVINRFQELFTKTEYFSANSVILETNITSDMITAMNKMVDFMFTDEDKIIAIKALIASEFIYSSTGLNADITTIRNFVDQLKTIVDS